MKIWSRYLFYRLAKTFLLILFCVLGLYVAVDFSIHGARFLSKETTSWIDIGANYLRHFAKFTGLFFSLSFLLAMLRVLLDLSAHREISALQTAGLSSKKLLSPFFFLAALLAAASYANFEWIAPDAQIDANDFYNAHSSRAVEEEKVFSLILQDGSELVYQKYDKERKELFDVFWIRSFQEIWHIKTLKIDSLPVEAQFADRFQRAKSGALEKTGSFEKTLLKDLHLDLKASLCRFIPFESRSLSSLASQAFGNSSDQAKSAAHLHYKLAFPAIPFLLIISLGPFALSYSRGRSQMLFVALALFAFVGLMTLLDAMLILAENRVLPSAAAIWGPIAFLMAAALVVFFRMD